MLQIATSAREALRGDQTEGSRLDSLAGVVETEFGPGGGVQSGRRRLPFIELEDYVLIAPRPISEAHLKAFELLSSQPDVGVFLAHHRSFARPPVRRGPFGGSTGATRFGLLAPRHRTVVSMRPTTAPCPGGGQRTGDDQPYPGPP